MEERLFGARLRELRKQAGLSQRELAEKIGVNFSYLSKIENGTMPPPSEKVLVKLAEALNVDRDELITLAGKIPSDIVQILRDRKALESLRKKAPRQKVSLSARLGGNAIMKTLLDYKKYARVATAVILVIAMAATMWYISPAPAVKALNITFPSLPSSVTVGNSYTFQVKVDVEDTDLLPVHHIDLQIYNASSPTSYIATAASLPIPGSSPTTETKSYTSAETGGGAMSVSVASAAGWIWTSTGSTRYGYGYRDPGGGGTHTLSGTFGYGYAYSSNIGETSVTYTITWTPPTNWPAGSYKVKALVYGDATKKWSGTSTAFSLSEADTAAPSPVVVAPGVTRVSGVVTSTGVFVADVTARSADSKLTLKIKMNTKGKTKQGVALSTITIQRVAQPPSPPANASHVGDTYDVGPDGATFDPPISLTLAYDPADLPAGFDETKLTVAVWDTSVTPPQWTVLGGTVDTTNHTITVLISHFTQYGILAITEEAPPVVTPPVVTPPVVEKPEVEKPVVEKPEVEKPEVEKPEVEKPAAPPVTPAPTGLAWWVWLLIVVGAVLIIGVVVLVIRRQRA